MNPFDALHDARPAPAARDVPMRYGDREVLVGFHDGAATISVIASEFGRRRNQLRAPDTVAAPAEWEYPTAAPEIDRIAATIVDNMNLLLTEPPRGRV